MVAGDMIGMNTSDEEFMDSEDSDYDPTSQDDGWTTTVSTCNYVKSFHSTWSPFIYIHL